MTPDALLEAVLFAAARPLSARKLAEVLETDAKSIPALADALSARLDASGSAVVLQRHGEQYELVTRPEAAETVAKVMGAEASGELTKAALETLTVLAYRGPLTRPELEQIRGVNCALILRNLLLRGLIDQTEDKRLGQAVFVVSADFLKHLGLARIEDLPEYAALHAHPTVAEAIQELDREAGDPTSAPEPIHPPRETSFSPEAGEGAERLSPEAEIVTEAGPASEEEAADSSPEEADIMSPHDADASPAQETGDGRPSPANGA